MALLDFPDSRQSTDFSCGAAAVQAILCYYGVDYREKDIGLALRSRPAVGTPVESILSYLAKSNLQTWAGKMTTQNLRAWIDRQVPVIIPIQAWPDKPIEDWKNDWEDGHYVIAIGYTDKVIVFEDPSVQGNRAYISEAELEDRWHDVGDDQERLEHFGIAVFGRPPQYNSKRILKLESLQRRVAARYLASRR